MYNQRVPHPLAYFTRGREDSPTLNAFKPSPSNGTTLSSVSQPKPHPIGYVILAVVLAILLVSLIGVFITRRRAGSLLPCSMKRNKKDEKVETPPRMQREGRGLFSGGFNVMPPLNVRTGRGSGSSHTPSSPYSEGPSTPIAAEENEHGDLGTTNVHKYDRDECAFVPIPIIVHTPSQTHQTTFLTGPDAPSPDLTAPTTHHEHFFDEHHPMTVYGSLIRPHGLPLSPVPEDSTAVSFSSPYFEVDEETLYGTPDRLPEH